MTNLRVMVGEVEPHEYSASLCVFSVTISLGELTAALGGPSSGYDRGDPRSPRAPGGPKRAHAGWILESVGGLAPLEAQIEGLVVFWEEHREVFVSRASEIDAQIICGIFSGTNAQGGFTLEPGLLSRLAEIGLPVVFDLY